MGTQGIEIKSGRQPEVAAGQVWHHLHRGQTMQYIIESVSPEGARATCGTLLNAGLLREMGTCVRPAPTVNAVREHATQADANGWFDWSGGDQPQHTYGQLVEILLRDGAVGPEPANAIRWDHTGSDGDIVRYRLIAEAGGTSDDFADAFDDIPAAAPPASQVKVCVGQVWRNHASKTQKVVVRMEAGKALLERDDGGRNWIAVSKMLMHWSLVHEDTISATGVEDGRGDKPTNEAFLERDLGDTDFVHRSQAAFVASVDGGNVSQQTPPAEDIDILDIFGEAANDEAHPYHLLVHVMLAAFAQAALGKGKERHASGGTPFHEQPMATINRQLGSVDGFIYQAHKKSLEAKRLPDGRAQAELLGSINYLAGAVIALDTWAKKDAA